VTLTQTQSIVLAFLGSFGSLSAAIVFASQPGRDETCLDARFAALQLTNAAKNTSTAQNDLLKSEVTGTSSHLQIGLRHITRTFKLDLLLRQSESALTVQKLLLVCACAALLGSCLAVVAIPIVSLIAGAGAISAYLPIVYLQIRRKRRIAAFDIALPDTIEMMSRSLRAGHSMVASISIVAEHAVEPAKSEFAEVFRKQNFGLPLRDALMLLLDQVPSQDLRLFVTGVLVQKDTGGNLAEILDRIVAVIRERLKIQGEIRIHTAQGRLTGWILCLMPVGLMIVLNLINPGYSKPLTSDPIGMKILCGGVGLLVFGAYLIKRIIDAIEV
jgi:tight adherence protein B